MASGALRAVGNFLGRFGVKAPWKVTGAASSVEYLEFMPAATEYRKHSPATPEADAAVPHATQDTVFDITYYKRDFRNPLKEQAAAAPEGEEQEATESKPKKWEPPTPGQPYRWTKRSHILDIDDGGYT